MALPGPSVSCPMEASGRLVGPPVFKTGVPARAGRRVRFPSASAARFRALTSKDAQGRPHIQPEDRGSARPQQPVTTPVFTVSHVFGLFTGIPELEVSPGALAELDKSSMPQGEGRGPRRSQLFTEILHRAVTEASRGGPPLWREGRWPAAAPRAGRSWRARPRWKERVRWQWTTSRPMRAPATLPPQ